MSTYEPRHVTGSARLSAASQAKLDKMVTTKGVKPTAVALGCSEHTVEGLRHGGTVRPDSVVRVEAALARVK